MKEQMIAYMQNIIDHYKAEKEDGFTSFANDYIEHYKHCKIMYEAITGEEVTIYEWKVMAKEA